MLILPGCWFHLWGADVLCCHLLHLGSNLFLGFNRDSASSVLYWQAAGIKCDGISAWYTPFLSQKSRNIFFRSSVLCIVFLLMGEHVLYSTKEDTVELCLEEGKQSPLWMCILIEKHVSWQHLGVCAQLVWCDLRLNNPS